MNDLAREALVTAALKGVKQIRGRLNDVHGGYCALGWLIETCRPVHWTAWTRYEIDDSEMREIVTANDTLGWDFLTIARKIGTKEETQEG